MNKVLKFLKEEDGPTAVEYAVMLAMILAACLGGIGFLGENAAGSFQGSADDINAHFTTAGITGSSP